MGSRGDLGPELTDRQTDTGKETLRGNRQGDKTQETVGNLEVTGEAVIVTSRMLVILCQIRRDSCSTISDFVVVCLYNV